MAIDLEGLERLAAQATPGPWVIRHGDGWYNKHSYEIEASNESHVAETLYAYNGEADAAYITAACNTLPTLIAENRALRERVRELEIREVDYIEERDALLSTKYALERQRAWLAERFSGENDGVPASKYFLQLAEQAAKEAGE